MTNRSPLPGLSTPPLQSLFKFWDACHGASRTRCLQESAPHARAREGKTDERMKVLQREIQCARARITVMRLTGPVFVTVRAYYTALPVSAETLPGGVLIGFVVWQYACDSFRCTGLGICLWDFFVRASSRTTRRCILRLPTITPAPNRSSYRRTSPDTSQS